MPGVLSHFNKENEQKNEMKCRCFRPLFFCTVKAEWGRGQLALMR